MEHEEKIAELAHEGELKTMVAEFCDRARQNYFNALNLVSAKLADEDLAPTVARRLAKDFEGARAALSKDLENGLTQRQRDVQREVDHVLTMGQLSFEALVDISVAHQIDTGLMTGDELRTIAMYKDWADASRDILMSSLDQAREVRDLLGDEAPEQFSMVMEMIEQFHGFLGDSED